MLTQINSTEECEHANNFPTIRLFTVNDGACVGSLYSCGAQTVDSCPRNSLYAYYGVQTTRGVRLTMGGQSTTCRM